MRGIKCVYYQTDAGRIPAKEFMYSLHIRTRQKIYEVIHLFQDHGKALPESHLKMIDDGIYELRCIGIEGKVRVLHFFIDQDKAVLTNGFIKKTQKTPKKEIKTAMTRRKIYLSRRKAK